jgi:hypothetical protein
VTTAAQLAAAAAPAAAPAAAGGRRGRSGRAAVTQTAAQRIREALSRIGVASAFDSAPEAAQWDPVKAAAKLTREQRACGLRRARRARSPVPRA